MNTININGKDFSIEELNNLIEKSKENNKMQKVFEYHGITEEKFNEDYKNASKHSKANAIIELIVSYYNKGEVGTYYPWFNSEPFSYYCCVANVSNSGIPAPLKFKRKEDLLEAIKDFLPQYEQYIKGN